MTAQEKVAALEAEQTTLTAAITTLADQATVQAGALDRLYAIAERSGTSQAVQDATEAEQAKQAIDTQLRRKRAALVIVTAELEAARQAAALADVLADVANVENLHSSMTAIAGQLDANAWQPELWKQLVQLADQAQFFYMKRLRNVETFAQFAPDPLRALDVLQHKFKQVVNGMMKPHEMDGVGLTLELPAMARRIAAIRAKVEAGG